MLATISASAPSAGREVCAAGSRLGHSIQKPRSFLIRDILGKCNESTSSDSDDHSEIEKPRCFYRERGTESSEEDLDRKSQSGHASSPVPTLSCRDWIKKDNLGRTHCHELSPFSKQDENFNHKLFNETETRSSRASKTSSEDQSPKYASKFVFPGFGRLHGVTDDPKAAESRSFHDRNINGSKDSNLDSDASSTVLRRFDLTQRQSLSQDPSSSSEDEGTKDQDNQRRSPSLNELYFEQEQLHRNMLDKLKEATCNSPKNFYHRLYPSTQNLIDLNYAFNLRAASAFGIPQLTLPLLSAYRNSLHTADRCSLSKSTPKAGSHLSGSHGARYDPYPRYRLLDWPQDRHTSLGEPNFPNLNKREILSSTEQRKELSSVFSDSSRGNNRSYSLHPTSPTYSEQSQSSPLPDNRPIQLPAYFRSRLGGSVSAEEANGGKSKKCRRSRTVFTELQVRMLMCLKFCFLSYFCVLFVTLTLKILWLVF